MGTFSLSKVNAYYVKNFLTKLIFPDTVEQFPVLHNLQKISFRQTAFVTTCITWLKFPVYSEQI